MTDVYNFEGSDLHVFKVEDRGFLLDVEHNALYSLSPKSYDLAKRRTHSVSEIDDFDYETWQAWRQLNRALKLVKPLKESDAAKIGNDLETSREEVTGLWLGLAHACNLACKYCFANEPSYLGDKGIMPWEVAKASIDYMLRASPERQNFMICFFGGEPLLNLDVLKKTVIYCQSLAGEGKHFDFSLTTNGTLLTPGVFEYLRDNDVGILLSIDGAKEIHDRFRRFHNGDPSWDVIVDNLSKIQDAGRYITVRATIPDAKVSLKHAFKTLRDLGFRQMAFTEVCSNSGKQSGFPAGDLEQWREGYLELARDLAAEVNSIYELPLLHLRTHSAGLFGQDRSYYCCITGINLFYVNPSGELFPCSRLLTDEKHFRLGTVFTGIDQGIVANFRQNHVFKRPCRTCWARYLCGGQCYGDTYFDSHDLGRPSPIHCEMQKWKIEVAAYVVDEFRRAGKLPSTEVEEQRRPWAWVRSHLPHWPASAAAKMRGAAAVASELE